MDAVDREGLCDGSHDVDDLRAVLRIGRAEPVDRVSCGVDLESVGLFHSHFETVRSFHGMEAVDPRMNLNAMLLRGRDAFLEGGLERLPWKKACGEIGGVGGGRVGEDGGDVIVFQQRDDVVPILSGQTGQRTAPNGAEFVGGSGDLLNWRGGRQLFASVRELDGCLELA